MIQIQVLLYWKPRVFMIQSKYFCTENHECSWFKTSTFVLYITYMSKPHCSKLTTACFLVQNPMQYHVMTIPKIREQLPPPTSRHFQLSSLWCLYLAAAFKGVPNLWIKQSKPQLLRAQDWLKGKSHGKTYLMAQATPMAKVLFIHTSQISEYNIHQFSLLKYVWNKRTSC